MATGNDFIVGAMRKIEINAAESAIESYETQDALDAFNDLFSSLEPTLGLGFKEITSASDAVRVPRSAHMMMKTNLAVHLLSEYGKPVTPLLAALASSTVEDYLRTTVKIDTEFPNSLPQGSGNECGSQYEGSRFFPTPDEKC